MELSWKYVDKQTKLVILLINRLTQQNLDLSREG